MNTQCPSPESGSGRHVVGAENIEQRTPLNARCLACGKAVKRAHSRSPWWYTEDDSLAQVIATTIGARGISILVEGEDAGDVGALFADALSKASNAMRDGLTVDTTSELRTAKATIRVETGVKP